MEFTNINFLSAPFRGVGQKYPTSKKEIIIEYDLAWPRYNKKINLGIKRLLEVIFFNKKIF
jgi:hypothetical protein